MECDTVPRKNGCTQKDKGEHLELRVPLLFLKAAFENTVAVVENCRTLHLQKFCKETLMKSQKREQVEERLLNVQSNFSDK